MRKHPRKRRRIVVVAVIAALVLVSAAVAAWMTASGTGPFGAKGAQTQTVTLTLTPRPQDVRAGHECSPAASCDLAGLVENPSSSQLTVTSVALAGPASVVGAPGCAIAGHLSLAAGTGVGDTIGPTAGGNTALLFEDGLSVDGTAPVCAAAQTWDVPITITAS